MMFKRRNLKRVVTMVLFLVVMIIVPIIAFIYGYSQGHNHQGNVLINRYLPSLLTDDQESEVVGRVFLLESTFNNEEVLFTNTVLYPHSWDFKEVKNNDNKETLNNKKFIITDFNRRITLTIIPKSINDFRSVMSATTEFTQEIQRKCLGSYDILESSSFDFISLYRENTNQNEIRYIQEVNSIINTDEDPLALNEFIVFKRDAGFVKGNELVWEAEITLEFDESLPNEEKEKYLKIIDDIVSSLQIK